MASIDSTTQSVIWVTLDDIWKEFPIFYRILRLPEPLYGKPGMVELFKNVDLELTPEFIAMVKDARSLGIIAQMLRQEWKFREGKDLEDDDVAFFKFFDNYEKIIESESAWLERWEEHENALRALPFVKFVRNLPKYQQLKRELFDKWR